MLKNEKIGNINAGSFADILILDANPLVDVTILDRPEDHLLGIIARGRVIKSQIPELKSDLIY